MPPSSSDKTNIPAWQKSISALSQPASQPPTDSLSPSSTSGMFSSLKASIRRRTRNSSTGSRNSADERDRRSPSPSPSPALDPVGSVQPSAPSVQQTERSTLANPSGPTRRPNRPGMNAFTVPSNEPPPAYTPAPTAASDPALGPSPVYSTNEAGSEDPYSFLTTFDTILLIDDSGSMAGRSWRETSLALSTLLPTIVSHDSNGIDIFFLNHQSRDPGSPAIGIAAGGYRNVTSAAEVQRIFDTVRPGGGTPTGMRCRALLKPYLAHLEAENARGAMDAVKPLNIVTITDGVPSDDVESVLLAAARKLDALDAAPHQVGLQFFQVGNEEGAKEALKELDDGIAEMVAGGVRDMVDTCTWTGGSSVEGDTPRLSGAAIMKVCLGSVVKRLDRRRFSLESRA